MGMFFGKKKEAPASGVAAPAEEPKAVDGDATTAEKTDEAEVAGEAVVPSDAAVPVAPVGNQGAENTAAAEKSADVVEDVGAATKPAEPEEKPTDELDPTASATPGVQEDGETQKDDAATVTATEKANEPADAHQPPADVGAAAAAASAPVDGEAETAPPPKKNRPGPSRGWVAIRRGFHAHLAAKIALEAFTPKKKEPVEEGGTEVAAAGAPDDTSKPAEQEEVAKAEVKAPQTDEAVEIKPGAVAVQTDDVALPAPAVRDLSTEEAKPAEAEEPTPSPAAEPPAAEESAATAKPAPGSSPAFRGWSRLRGGFVARAAFGSFGKRKTITEETVAEADTVADTTPSPVEAETAEAVVVDQAAPVRTTTTEEVKLEVEEVPASKPAEEEEPVSKPAETTEAPAATGKSRWGRLRTLTAATSMMKKPLLSTTSSGEAAAQKEDKEVQAPETKPEYADREIQAPEIQPQYQEKEAQAPDEEFKTETYKFSLEDDFAILLKHLGSETDENGQIICKSLWKTHSLTEEQISFLKNQNEELSSKCDKLEKKVAKMTWTYVPDHVASKRQKLESFEKLTEEYKMSRKLILAGLKQLKEDIAATEKDETLQIANVRPIEVLDKEFRTAFDLVCNLDTAAKGLGLEKRKEVKKMTLELKPLSGLFDKELDWLNRKQLLGDAVNQRGIQRRLTNLLTGDFSSNDGIKKEFEAEYEIPVIVLEPEEGEKGGAPKVDSVLQPEPDPEAAPDKEEGGFFSMFF
ncbi:unnamed protein product [Amoebophrya sp. A120]|nr:unnamed protein product [Amoebophrya sp. A120]|eukprot:GSA120T00019833001.1